MTGVLTAERLRVGYPRRRSPTVLLDDLSVTLEAGALTFLLGPNGSGKTTLLRTLTGMQPALAGRVRLLGDDVARMPSLERAQRLAVVLTDQVDAGLMRVIDLVALGRYPYTGWAGRLGATDHACVRWALEVTGAAALAERSVAELSDGERQRVLVARALAQEPAVLALDEPVAYVDVARRVELTGLLRRLARERGLAVLLTSHDLDLAIRTADTVWLLEPDTPARVHVGAPEDLVLAGAVGRAFSGGGVDFDLRDGRFVGHPATVGCASVAGDGAPAVWTARALEREGLAVVPADAPADLAVEIVDRGGTLRWRLRAGGGVHEADSVGALLVEVRGTLPAVGRRPASTGRRP